MEKAASVVMTPIAGKSADVVSNVLELMEFISILRIITDYAPDMSHTTGLLQQICRIHDYSRAITERSILCSLIFL